jgi:DNA-binding LytR/AlgR family response regulator
MRPVQFYSLYIDLTQDIRLELDVFPRNISFYFTNASSLDHARNLIEQEYFEVIIFNVDNVGEEEVCLIADIPKNTSIIVISNDYDTIFDPHDIDNVILFTLKPIDPEKLQNLLIRFLSKYVLPKVKHLDHFDFFFTGSEMTKINFNDIFYVEAVGTFSNVFLLDQVILVKESILH